MSRVLELYREYVVDHGLERDGLFRLLRGRFTLATVLYPGCFLHVAPSFSFQHVVYVDRDDLAARFFADEAGVRRLVDGRKRYPQAAHLRFIHQDYTLPLPLREGSFDLLLALYAPGVSRACVAYLRPGGLLLSNDHHGDAADAAANPALALIGVLHERRGTYRLQEQDLGGYLVPRGPGAIRGRQLAGSPDYVRRADGYLFRRRRGPPSPLSTP